MSSEAKDPKIKLFGKTIELPENSAADEGGGEPDNTSNQDPPSSSDSMLEDSNLLSGDAGEHQSLKSPSLPEQAQSKQEDKPGPATLSDEPKDPPTDIDPSAKHSKTEEDQTDQNGKTLKKPDKILPCPRCNSMDTKFCYFNNYNVNQPRHFCKNCQRYWTAGGTMRNVPVGAGRRKNKNASVSHFRHLAVPADPHGAHHPNPSALSPNGTVLTFGSDSPLCESITSVLNIVDQSIRNGPKNGLHRPEETDNGPSKSSITSTDESPVRNCNPVPCYPGPHWAYPWNPVQWASGSFPMPFYSGPPPYWGWNVPWVIPPAGPAAFGPNSPTLGKHSREGSLKEESSDHSLKVSNPEKCLWVPKTLRIDDPGEAAKSSIWATLGIKKDGNESDGMFKAFRSEGKVDAKSSSHVTETSTVLQANPAAMSRSLSFHESS